MGDYQYILLKDVVLTGQGSYPVSRLTVSYNLDEVSAASVTLALGRDIATGAIKRMKLSASSVKQEWKITVKTASASKDVFKGYLLSVKEDFMRSPTGSRVSVVLTFAGKAVKLRTINASSYQYWSADSDTEREDAPEGAEQDTESLNTLTNTVLDSMENPVDPTEDFGGFMVEAMGEVQKRGTHGDTDGKTILGECVKNIKKTPIRDTCMEAVGADAAGPTLESEFLDAFIAAWGSADMFEAMRGIANQFYLRVVPQLDGTVSLNPVLAWLKKSDATLDIKDVIGCSRGSDSFNKMMNVDHVGVAIPSSINMGGMFTNYKYWPEDDSAAGRAKIMSLPRWMAARIPDLWEAEVSDDETLSATKYKDEGNSDQAVEKNKTVATELAKAEFALCSAASETMEVTLRWDRFDYLDKIGYIMKIPFLSDPDAAGQYYFGLVTGVRLDMEVGPQSGRCFLTMSVANCRSSADNDKYGLDEHPIYNV